MRFTIFIIMLLLLSWVFTHDQPMVGVISFPYKDTSSKSYVQAETVKFAESSGARVVAVPYDQTWTTSADVLDKLNGILLQNNFFRITVTDATYNDTLNSAYKYVADKNDGGVVFPLWASGDAALLLSEQLSTLKDLSKYTVTIDALDYATKINIKEDRTTTSTISVTNTIRDDFLRYATSQNIIYFNQDKGIQ